MCHPEAGDIYMLYKQNNRTSDRNYIQDEQ